MESKIINLIKENEILTTPIIESFIYGLGVDSTNRMNCYAKLCINEKNQINDITYWECLSQAYIGSDNINFQVPYPILKSLFSANRENREFLMNEDERMYLKSLSEIVKIYRGCSSKEKESNRLGISWTLSKKVAEFYVSYHRNGVKDGIIIEKEINKNEIIAYFNEREEQEIIYFASDK